MAQHAQLDQMIQQLPNCVKRGKYIQYSKNPEVVSRVLTILKANRRGDIQKISAQTKFKIRTLYNWRDMLMKDPNFNPLLKKPIHQKEYLQMKKRILYLTISSQKFSLKVSYSLMKTSAI